MIQQIWGLGGTYDKVRAEGTNKLFKIESEYLSSFRRGWSIVEEGEMDEDRRGTRI